MIFYANQMIYEDQFQFLFPNNNNKLNKALNLRFQVQMVFEMIQQL